MPISKKLQWDDISNFAEDKFNVWSNDAGQLWAKKAWNILEKEGLTEYKNEIERHIVIIRLLTLATMYNEFCYLVWDEYFDYPMVGTYWLDDEVFFNPIRVWQLVGIHFYKEEKIEEIEVEDLLTEALLELIDNQRNLVYGALNKHLREDLFWSLILTRYTKEDGTEYDIEKLTAEDEKMIDYDQLDENEERGLYWITIGMPRNPLENC